MWRTENTISTRQRGNDQTLHMILQIEIPKGQPESVETKDRQCKGQKDSQYNDQKDKQLSTKHYTEN